MGTQTQKIYNLLAKFNTGMLVTQSRDMTHYARPLSIIKIEANCDIWFFTARSSQKAREIELDQKIVLIFQNDQGRYITISGRAELISDHVQIAALWKESSTIWFPDDTKDPNPILIRVASEEVEYWDASQSKTVRHLFAAAKARFTGKPPQIEEFELHERMTLKPVFAA